MLSCDLIWGTYYDGCRHSYIYLRANYLSSFLSCDLRRRWRNISNFGSESVRIPFKYDSDGFLTNTLVFIIIAAPIAIAILAILSTSKAFAVKF